jgi:pyrroloquinoline quinone (PQQ) biosynthesis protein C
MSFYERLKTATQVERQDFLSLPLVQRTIKSGASRELYLDFLGEAYHHVKHTFPQLALAASSTDDETYQDALVEYMEEERGHEKWILDDITAMGGHAVGVRTGKPRMPCRMMVGYTYYAIERISPYAMLGSVHVLEGMSTVLADKVADAVNSSLGQTQNGGFSYLRSHGALDVAHVALFRDLVDKIREPAAQEVIVETAKTIYHLYGGIFRELGERHIGTAPEAAHAA